MLWYAMEMENEAMPRLIVLYTREGDLHSTATSFSHLPFCPGAPLAE